jgi:2-polyprenyl-3-methyl-5-hydroxy-6-metoxy-1,4-benzoquinol methylase
MRSGPSGSHVEIITEGASQPFSEEWFDLARSDHFWFAWRLRAALALASDHQLPLDRELSVFEVGCGAGILRGQLEAATAWRVDGTDLDLDALRRIPSGRGRLFRYDVLEKRERFREAYDAIVLFDVLEHVESTGPFLESVVHHLKPGGHLMLNVPALPRLYSRYDVAAGHHRRYDRESLGRELHGLPLTVLEARYWGLSLVALAAARKLWLAVSGASGGGIIERGFEPPGRIVHGALQALMSLETRLIRRPPVGASLLLLASRR